MKLSLRDFPIEREEVLGPRDVRIKLHTVGICGSDVHYYTHGGAGIFQVKAPMILGHEAAGIVMETGAEVTSLKIGDRVCMEPGIPDPNSRATRLGMYNVDPAVRFWATPPIHGVLRPTVVHPENFTFKLPDNVSFAEAAMVEPLAVGVHAATKAQVKPGDIALVIGAGPIGLVTALSALAAGCARVFVSDVDETKLELAAKLGPITPDQCRQTGSRQGDTRRHRRLGRRDRVRMFGQPACCAGRLRPALPRLAASCSSACRCMTSTTMSARRWCARRASSTSSATPMSFRAASPCCPRARST